MSICSVLLDNLGCALRPGKRVQDLARSVQPFLRQSLWHETLQSGVGVSHRAGQSLMTDPYSCGV
jgi:hypothetical protein